MRALILIGVALLFSSDRVWLGQAWAQESTSVDTSKPADWLSWNELPNLPDALGVAGPFVGVHDQTLLVAGGANFPPPVWENNKVWYDHIYAVVEIYQFAASVLNIELADLKRQIGRNFSAFFGSRQ